MNINYDKMPANGYVLGYFRTNIVFQGYNQVSELKEILENNGQLLELHVFDDVKEYRFVAKDDGQAIEQLIEDEEGKDTKVELVKVEDNLSNVMSVLKVVNYIDYDENGMITIDNYRLAPGKGGIN
ncbi:MAG: hypothetical protein IJZ96_10200 [Lachnospiraceae bacterium]|nr:hypothetical protein [Lachnospiraceae bacterium]